MRNARPLTRRGSRNRPARKREGDIRTGSDAVPHEKSGNVGLIRALGSGIRRPPIKLMVFLSFRIRTRG
jgi:hypothetical protein